VTGQLRRPGGRWRLLVHEWAGREPGRREGVYSVSHHIGPAEAKQDSVWRRNHELPNTEFDELVVGRWLHVEQMDIHCWWMNIAGITVHVWADRDGRPTHATVHGPDEWGAAVDGCEYTLVWPVSKEPNR
jgi:hypothetical protein